jgi:hypothetical protein
LAPYWSLFLFALCWGFSAKPDPLRAGTTTLKLTIRAARASITAAEIDKI